MKTFVLSLLLALVSCQDKKSDAQISDKKLNTVFIPDGTLEVSLIFGHNVNGETHPCGCREHPLGGLPQVAGALAEAKEKTPVIYVDSGDMLFSANKMPAALEKGWRFTADNLVNAMNMLKLNYAVPGDYDLTIGATHLQELAKKMQYPYLISNAHESLKLGQKEFDVIESSGAKIFFTGVVAPDSLPEIQKSLFTDPYKGLEQVINKIKSAGFDEKNKRHFLIVLSHSGIEIDKALALKFPMIDWIIGSHSQKFTQIPIFVNNTRLVQVLSRNHYLGHITLNLKDPERSKYAVIQTRDEMKDKAVPNPMIEFLEKHKNQLQKIQFEEQEALRGQAKAGEKYPTAAACITCHTDQGEKWHSTGHALALTTLISAQADKNPECIGCHSVGHQEKAGFVSLSEIALVKIANDAHKLKAAPQLYWDEVKQIADKIPSVRKLKPSTRRKYSKKWLAMDDKHEILHQFGNVQCLNCHDQDIDHPYDSKKKPSKTERKKLITGKCLECHNYDQSPGWYKGNDIEHSLDQKKFDKTYKAIACPKYSP